MKALRSIIPVSFALCSAIVFFAVQYLIYLIFITLPNERTMGAVQKIFYFHVGAATACYLAIAVVFVCSLLYLATRSKAADCWGEAAAEVAFLLATIVLVTGMIWGKVAWGVAFNWEPRLVSFLILWFILLSLVLLRSLSSDESRAQHCAVLGIVGAISIPIVIYSIKLLPEINQLHPVVVERGGLTPQFKSAMLLSIVIISAFSALLIWIRARLSVAERLLDTME